MIKLIGMLDSPYVRRVAIACEYLNVPFEHQSLSVFRDVDQFRHINPLIKAPTLICDDGTVLMDSTLILDHVEDQAGPGQSLMPPSGPDRQRALRLLGLGLAICEKSIQIYYERTLRPTDKQHQPWLERVEQQLRAGCDALASEIQPRSPWLLGSQLLQPDITVAVAWRFLRHIIPDVIADQDYPELAGFSAIAEAQPEFLSTPLL
jgi:glutathione S-transferase